MPSPEPASLPPERQLALRPQRNRLVEEREDGPGRLRVGVPQHYQGLLALARRLLPLRDRRSWLLDGPGLEVWRRIDGTASVADLIAWLEREEGLSFHEARLLLAQYLGTLTRRGLVAVEVDPEPR